MCYSIRNRFSENLVLFTFAISVIYTENDTNEKDEYH